MLLAMRRGSAAAQAPPPSEKSTPAAGRRSRSFWSHSHAAFQKPPDAASQKPAGEGDRAEDQAWSK